MPLMEPMRFGARRSGVAGLALTPDDEESLVRSAARAGLSGLGKVGNLLDTPGSIVRDLLTWLPGGPAPVNPLDQLLSPLSGENRTSGRQLLEGYGMRANRETGMGGWLSDPGEGLRVGRGAGRRGCIRHVAIGKHRTGATDPIRNHDAPRPLPLPPPGAPTATGRSITRLWTTTVPRPR